MRIPRSIPVEAVEALLAVPRPVPTLGCALWLYTALLLRAMSNGIAIRMRDRFARDLGVSEEDVERWLTRLVRAALIEIQSPSPYLVIRIRKWPGSASPSPNETPESGAAAAAPIREVPVSSSMQAAAIKQSGEGGLGEGDALLAEAWRAIPDADPAEVAALVRKHPVAVVRRALIRVRATPAREIRRSKTALFRFLLAKLSETTDVHHV